MAYAADSKSADLDSIVGSSPTASTNKKKPGISARLFLF